MSEQEINDEKVRNYAKSARYFTNNGQHIGFGGGWTHQETDWFMSVEIATGSAFARGHMDDNGRSHNMDDFTITVPISEILELLRNAQDITKIGE